jgi:pimeloyl-ACP methyl ester carboxylesterase
MIDNSILWKNQSAYQRMQNFYDRELANITVPYSTCYIDTRYGKTHVLTAGNPENPPLVFWHGMNASILGWINEINAFSDEYFVVAADCPGDTGRSAPNRMNRKTMQHGEWAADVLNAVGIQSAYHVGISGGGWLILKLANVAPEKIKAAVLMSTGGFINVDIKILFKMLPLMMILPPKKLVPRFIKLMGVPNREPSAGELETFELIFDFKSERGVPALPDAELQKLTAPTMLLMGEYESAFKPPAKVIERAQKTLPNLLSAEILQGVAHGMNGENPELVHGKIRAFLAEQAKLR